MAIYVKTNTFTANTTIQSSQVNANFNEISTAINTTLCGGGQSVIATSGGTGQTTYATGDTLYASAANTLSKLSGNTTTAIQYLSQTGTGSASQAPAWGAIDPAGFGSQTAARILAAPPVAAGNPTFQELTPRHLLAALALPVVRTFTSGSGTLNSSYKFIVTSASATTGATYTNNSITFTVVDTIASSTVLTLTGSGAPTTSGTLTKASGTGDATITFSQFIAPLYANVEGIAGGGGGSGSGVSATSANNGTAGGNTTFGTGTTLITATGGSPGTISGPSSPGGAGGACTIGSALVGRTTTGGSGTSGSYSQGTDHTTAGGCGGNGAFGGAGGGGDYNAAGLAAATNSGSGGGGGGHDRTGASTSGAGGGSGGSFNVLVGVNGTAYAASYAYAVGAAGGAGPGNGALGKAGGAGAAGLIKLIEFFQ
jgi:hypothetical protein